MAIQALRELKKTYGPNIVFLMETRNDRETMEKVRKKIKYDNFHYKNIMI